MVKEAVSKVVEDYLVTIYRLERRYGVARTSNIARALGVSLGTVTNNLARLRSMSLIERTPYRGVRLTERGRALALEIIRRHRLVERLLTDVLGVEWHRAHEYAHRLEHGFRGLEDYLERALGNPERCPHGNPIKEVEGEERLRLSEVSEGLYEVIGVDFEEGEVLRYLEENELKPGAVVEVLSARGAVSVRLDSRVIEVPAPMASVILVREVRRGA